MLRRILLTSTVLVLTTLSFANGAAMGDDRPVAPEAVQAVPTNAAPQSIRAKEIIGSAVSLEGGASAGTIDDIVLDQAGNVDYLIVVNEQRKLVTVPWDAAMFDLRKRTATIHIAPEQFRQVPTYSVQQYPVFSTPTYRTEIYKYYGLTPGQQRRAIHRMERQERREERRENRRND